MGWADSGEERRRPCGRDLRQARWAPKTFHAHACPTPAQGRRASCLLPYALCLLQKACPCPYKLLCLTARDIP